MKSKTVYLPDLVGKGYKRFWNFRGRYRVVKGSRASKKSKTAALWFIYNLMKYPKANLLVIRKTYRTLKDSCFTDLQWACERLKVSRLWDFKLSPLEATYKPTGQKILFRGLDDPLKVTSITVPSGALCWGWIEEAYELNSEADFDMLNESIRGEIPEGLWKQWTLTLNPWNEHHWIKKRFFDRPDENTLAITTNYQCNEWLDEADLKLFEEMKKNNPRRYQVAGLGNWGIVDGLVFENWREDPFTLDDVRNCESINGLDFGYANDPAALFVGFIDQQGKKIYVWDELYKKGLTNRRLFEEITKMGYAKKKIVADSAEPKSIDELRGYGLRMASSVKGKDSVNHGIQFIQDYEIIVHPRCVHFVTEISNYTWDKDRFGNSINRPIDDFNHLMDAMRYSVERFSKGSPKLKTYRGGI
ncbi:PBSX family phage terminase large subunit [uncultured Dubosiella sp.]|uniref:PBSX family phage terminase large subunit n=1 Tax=uncultured Dubosiella sp. TaxID=1937011 RepID=UPI0027317275|nr:PBSX family phage terminase large subunit [uncultured Dubosiella sp.]